MKAPYLDDEEREALLEVDPGGYHLPIMRGMDWFLVGFGAGIMLTGVSVAVWMWLR